MSEQTEIPKETNSEIPKEIEIEKPTEPIPTENELPKTEQTTNTSKTEEEITPKTETVTENIPIEPPIVQSEAVPSHEQEVVEPKKIEPKKETKSSPFGGWGSWLTDLVIPPVPQESEHPPSPPPPSVSEEVQLLPETAFHFVSHFFDTTTSVVNKVQQKVTEIAKNIKDEGITKTSEKLLNELSDTFEKLSFIPTLSPDGNEEVADPLSFQTAFLSLNGYKTAKTISDLGTVIENELLNKRGLLSPTVSNIYEATFVTIDNELTTLNTEFTITVEEEAKWNWTEITTLLDFFKSIEKSLEPFKLPRSLVPFRECLNKMLVELQQTIVTFFATITSLYLQIVLQAALYYHTNSEYYNPSQAVRLAEVIKFKLHSFDEKYRNFVEEVHSFSFPKSADENEENVTIHAEVQGTYQNYIQLLDSQARTLMLSKCEIFNSLVKSRMINES